MKNVLDTINHPKTTPEKIKQMKDNGWTDQEIAEKMYDLESYYSNQAIGSSENKKVKILVDANEKIVEIKYVSGGTNTYSCSKLR